MQTEGVFQLSTPRLILRDFTMEDWPAILAYQGAPEYLRFYPWTSRTEEDVRGFIQMFLDWQQAQPRHRFQLAVARRDTGECIGNAGIRCPAPGSPHAELGYELAPQHWGQGFATEAARALLDYGWQELKLTRVEASCNAENLASQRVLEKLGFALHERQDRDVYFKGRWWDTLIYHLEPSP